MYNRMRIRRIASYLQQVGTVGRIAVMLNEEASSIVFENVYDTRKPMPWLNRLRRLASSALYEEFAMPEINPVEENTQLLGGSFSVQPE